MMRYRIWYHIHTPKDVERKLDRLARRPYNVKGRELESAAKAAGWVHRRTTGSHAIYKKAGFRQSLAIPRHPGTLKRTLAGRLIEVIRESLKESPGGEP